MHAVATIVLQTRGTVVLLVASAPAPDMANDPASAAATVAPVGVREVTVTSMHDVAIVQKGGCYGYCGGRQRHCLAAATSAE